MPGQFLQRKDSESRAETVRPGKSTGRSGERCACPAYAFISGAGAAARWFLLCSVHDKLKIKVLNHVCKTLGLGEGLRVGKEAVHS